MADLEFPRLVHKGTATRRVNTKTEFDAAVKDGFTEHADPPIGSPAATGKKSDLPPESPSITAPVSVNSAPVGIPGDAEQSKAPVSPVVQPPAVPTPAVHPADVRGPVRPKGKE